MRAIGSAIGAGDSRARYRAGKAASPDPTPPVTANSASQAHSADVRHEHLDDASYDNEKATEKKFRRRRRISGSGIYFLPCLGAAVSVLILVIDVRWTAQERSRRRAKPVGATGEGHPVVGSLGKTSHRLKATLVRTGDDGQTTPLRKQGEDRVDAAASFTLSSGATDAGTSHNRFQEVSLHDLGFIDGRKALQVGNRFESHTDSQGRPLPWWTQRHRQHDNYASDLDFNVRLDVTFLDAQHFRRTIQYEEQSLVPSLDSDDRARPAEKNYDQYDDPMDDDAVISQLFTRKNENRQCRQPEWYGLQFPTCNSFHEMTMVHSGSESSYLGRGYFRMAFSIKEMNQPWFILKVMRWRTDQSAIGMFHREFYEKTRVDGLVMERLSASPRITDMYGFCATSVMSEPLPGELWGEAVPTERTIQKHELQDEEHLDPKNQYTPTEKIEMALDLAEALAELHGFADGMIVHDDIDLGQYLRTPDGRIKLNDFNRAKIQLWDPTKQEYCKYYNGHIGGKMRAPEEFVPDILNEKIDIFALGNSFYGLLTGLWPHYFDNSEAAQLKVMKGKMPYIDKRWKDNSFAEGQLVRAIEMCLHLDPDDRSDIFAIVNFLRDAVDENRRRREEKKK
mmetsp:Transcript_32250/g.94946  ORF Transcript_32250/g.94946 Transcript_32250/m.94946 type:complete len:622 (-) Transcript_32250:116-1981(-)